MLYQLFFLLHNMDLYIKAEYYKPKFHHVYTIPFFHIMGEYNHTIDAKSRLIIPSKFREILGDEFVVTKGLDGCLFVKRIQKIYTKKLRLFPTQKEPIQHVVSALFSSTQYGFIH